MRSRPHIRFLRYRRHITSMLAGRGRLAVMLFAWLLATGSHWDLVQTFAWGRMIATYAQSMSLPEAVRLTFKPDNLCGVCESVSEAKQQQQDPTLPSEGKLFAKILLVFEPPLTFSPVLSVADHTPAHSLEPCDRDRRPPPVPPPRVLV